MSTKPLAILVFAVLLTPSLFSEASDAAHWIQSEPRAHVYETVRPEILGFFDSAQKAGIPTGPLLDKLKEGVYKGVPAELLVSTLHAELDRLSVATKLVTRAERVFSEPAAREEAVRTVSLLLSAGTEAQTVQSLLAAAAGARRDSSDTMLGMAVLLQMKLSVNLSDASLQLLGTALFRSRQPSAVFGSVPAFFLRASSQGLEADKIVSMIVDVLNNGGGLIQMQDQLQDEASARTHKKGNESGTAQPSQPGGTPSHAPTHSGRHSGSHF